MIEMQSSLDQLKLALSESKALKRYRAAKEELYKDPALEGRIMELRKRNYLLQNNTDELNILTEMEYLRKEYLDVYSNPVAQEFLNAEVAVCRILQQITREVIEVIDFEDVLYEEKNNN